MLKIERSSPCCGLETGYTIVIEALLMQLKIFFSVPSGFSEWKNQEAVGGHKGWKDFTHKSLFYSG